MLDPASVGTARSRRRPRAAPARSLRISRITSWAVGEPCHVLARGRRRSFRPARRHPLHGDDRHGVPDDVVQLTGRARAPPDTASAGSLAARPRPRRSARSGGTYDRPAPHASRRRTSGSEYSVDRARPRSTATGDRTSSPSGTSRPITDSLVDATLYRPGSRSSTGNRAPSSAGHGVGTRRSTAATHNSPTTGPRGITGGVIAPAISALCQRSPGPPGRSGPRPDPR